MGEKPPNPGSNEAVKHGCICPVSDNRRGLGVPWNEVRLFWYSEGCPLHDTPPEIADPWSEGLNT